jgi:hypothetical protein
MRPASVGGRVLCAAVAAVVLGCSSPLDVTVADFEGTVESVQQDVNGTAVVIGDIEPAPGPGPAGDPAGEFYLKKQVWIVANSSVLVRQPDGSLRSGSAADIAVGTRVRVKTTGTEVRTLPPQYYARWVEVPE